MNATVYRTSASEWCVECLRPCVIALWSGWPPMRGPFCSPQCDDADRVLHPQDPKVVDRYRRLLS